MDEAMTREIGEIKGRLGRIESHVDVLKKDVGVLKSDMGTLKSDVADLKKTDKRIISVVVDLSAKMDQVIEKMATKDDISGLDRRMDAFAGQQEDMRFRWAVHADTLVEHDKRLKKLESRRA